MNSASQTAAWTETPEQNSGANSVFTRACKLARSLILFSLCCTATLRLASADSPAGDPGLGWQNAVLAAQADAASHPANSSEAAAIAEQLSIRLEREFPLYWDWCCQDAGTDFRPWLESSAIPALVQKVIAELDAAGQDVQREFDRLQVQTGPIDSRQWLALYSRAAELRRAARLRMLLRDYPKWVFTKHHVLGGSHYAYTEGQSDAQQERQFDPGGVLCLLDLRQRPPQTRCLIETSEGVIRDPDVSWDGQRVLFAWKKSDRGDDYHLYEMVLADGTVKQLTHGLGFADYEGIYLPNGDLLFNSTRCVQTVDCWWTEVSNLYTCASDGRHLRRLTFDQVHDNCPTVMPDGRLIYTRWEYNDRGQLFVQGLFQMNPDGTSQTEFYGNNSWFPTSLLHARGIPGSRRVVAIFSGHHTRQVGKLGIVDPARGRQENAGTQLIAPIRPTPAERIDAYGQDGELFQYPFPIGESEFVVAYTPLGWSRSPTLFKLYWFSVDGRRELLAADPNISCSQPVPLNRGVRPPARPNSVDYRQATGTCYLQDIYAGPGLAGVPRGTVKKLRAIALEYRAAGIGLNYNSGPAGEALVSTPIAIGNGSWDVKTVLGDATVYPDGSAFFRMPVRKPIYFQAIDAQGCAVQTMRSWATLQPGENVACVGCHESKNTTPLTKRSPSQALAHGPQELEVFLDQPRGFSYIRDVQPILDRHCVRCHRDGTLWEKRTGLALAKSASSSTASIAGGAEVSQIGSSATGAESPAADANNTEVAFSLLGTPWTEKLAKRRWSVSYLALVRPTEQTQEGNRYLGGTTNAVVNWLGAQSVPDMLPPYAAGAARSRLVAQIAEGHHQVHLTRKELATIACWIDLQVPFCGDYEEANAWTPKDQQTYRHFLDKRRQMEELEMRNIADLVSSQKPTRSD